MYTAVIYFSTDIGRSFVTFIHISISIVMSGICSMAYGFFLSGLFESVFIGIELSAIADLILLLVSGIYMSVKTVPLLKYISFFFYANETVSIHFWLTVDEIKCSPNPERLCFPNGTSVLESLSFGTTELDIYKDYCYQFVLTIVLHILAFIGIRRNVRKAGFY
jgi:ATP-binding cassette, subfamily G (WHITE), eye pigment precursor transporter